MDLLYVLGPKLEGISLHTVNNSSDRRMVDRDILTKM